MFVTRQWTNGRLALSHDHPPFSSSSASFWPLGTSQEPRTSSPRARRSILVCPGPAMALALSAAGPTVSRGELRLEQARCNSHRLLPLVALALEGAGRGEVLHDVLAPTHPGVDRPEAPRWVVSSVEEKAWRGGGGIDPVGSIGARRVED